MKPIQILVDEQLLRDLDADEEVRKHGRSAVLRRAAAEYLRRVRSRRIAEQYRRAYSEKEQVSEELEGWASEGVWPEE
jgi:metal-responsive CopG/Arc/MetJ family transcriptional regulator